MTFNILVTLYMSRAIRFLHNIFVSVAALDFINTIYL